MQVIPVLDLLDGHVVRAVRGERTAYRPIQSRLAAASEPLPLARALLAASGARTLYIADLGAILQRGAHASMLAALRAALPGIELWLDAGYADYASMRALFDHIDAIGQPAGHVAHHDLATLVPVFGTESLREIRCTARGTGCRPLADPLARSPGGPVTGGHRTRALLRMVALACDRDDPRSGRQLRRT